MKTFLLTLLVFIQLFSFAIADELLFVQAIWRHGDRTPAATYPTDPYINYSWPQGWGALTFKGMEQHLHLGKRLRDRYVAQLGFISSEYNSSEVYIRSTDVDRTLMSAMSNMVGMFPGSPGDFPDDQDWPVSGNKYGWVPVPIHTVNIIDDYVLIPDLPCNRQDELHELGKETPEYQQLSENMTDFLDLVRNETGLPLLDLGYLPAILDALAVEDEYGLSLPDWVVQNWTDSGKTVYDVMNETSNIVGYWSNGLKLEPMEGIDFSIEIPKLRGGPLLWTLIDNMQQKLYCVDNPTDVENCTLFGNLKYYAYSGHDVTIASLFSALGFKMTNWNEDGFPKYSSCVTVELWRTENKTNYVKFMYFPPDQDTADMTDSVSNCGKTCTLESLKNRSQIYNPLPDIQTLYSFADTEIDLDNNKTTGADDLQYSTIPTGTKSFHDYLPVNLTGVGVIIGFAIIGILIILWCFCLDREQNKEMHINHGKESKQLLISTISHPDDV
ncbi:hypothetical protein FO519_009524 [Halicephalobus sp. NKZ332]|nr:hypothetical protein FO519_009524 [Halicephalobus sp. NKZ332]